MDQVKPYFQQIKKITSKKWLRIVLTTLTAMGVSFPLLEGDALAMMMNLLPTNTITTVKVDTVWLMPPSSTDLPEQVWRSSQHQIASPVKTEIITPTPNKRTRIGAICKDGTKSTSTGRGACSRHDGVQKWLYAISESEFPSTVRKQAFIPPRVQQKIADTSLPKKDHQVPPPQHSEFDLMHFALLICICLILVVMIKKALPS